MAEPSKGARRRGLLGVFGKIGGEGRTWWVKTLRWIAFLGVTGFATAVLGFFILYRAIEIPDPNADFQTQTTKVYYSDGVTEIGSFATQDRENVSLDEVPASMQAAVIAAEDRSFYSNRGIDFKGILRAVRNNATSGSTQGASTITQQYVKILYLNQEQTYTRKIKEAILSLKIHNQLSKAEILEGYLNTVYYGNGAYGVQVASQTYFGKDAAELTVPESALLATIINSPSRFDPYTPACVADSQSAECESETVERDQRILPRYNYVINGMEEAGAITAEEADQYRGVLPAVIPKTVNNRFAGTNGFLLNLVEQQMQELQFSAGQIYGGGLRIVTTFDAPKQQAAVDAVEAVAPEGLDELHTAIVAVEPGSGAVRAMYGGPDFLASQINWATAGVQPGSAFKVFAVIAGLEDGYSLTSQLNGSSPMQVGGGVVENQGDSGGASYGMHDLAFATAKSVNTAFVDLTEQMSDGGDISIGAQKVLDAAVEAGIPQATVDAIDPVAVTSLGYAPVAPIDMANAYATIAASGKRADWYVIETVSSAQGASLHEHRTKAKQAVPSDVAADTLAALQGVTQGNGTGTNGRTVCPTAGKTGTATATDEHGDSRVSSSWFVGATPKLATAVMYNRGVGNEELDGYLRPFFGGTYPAQTFRAFMNAALDASDCGTFPKPANLKSSKGTTYKPPPPSCGVTEQLNESKTACVPRPVPECSADQKLDDSGYACVPKTCEDQGQTGQYPNCVVPDPDPPPVDDVDPTPTDPDPDPPGTSPQGPQQNRSPALRNPAG